MERKLRDVEQMPEAESVALLGLDDLGVGDDDEPEEIMFNEATG